MQNSTLKVSKSKNIHLDKSNSFIKEIILPIDFWDFTLSLKDVQISSSESQEISDNQLTNIYEFKSDGGNGKGEIPFFLKPRPDWNIKQGDFIVKDEKKINKRVFTKRDFNNIITNLWYIILSAFATYYILLILNHLP